MAEYIEREALPGANTNDNDYADGWNECLEAINAIPAADVRKVVLCKNCEFYMQSNFVDDHMECVRFNHPTAPDDFCSHGVYIKGKTDDV